jgi:hypothetical protein
VSLLEEAIAGILETAAAAEASEHLKQQALENEQGAAEAESAAAQLQDEHTYALGEAEAADKAAEDLLAEGRTTESMSAAATASRCARRHQRFRDAPGAACMAQQVGQQVAHSTPAYTVAGAGGDGTRRRRMSVRALSASAAHG